MIHWKDWREKSRLVADPEQSRPVKRRSEPRRVAQTKPAKEFTWTRRRVRIVFGTETRVSCLLECFGNWTYHPEIIDRYFSKIYFASEPKHWCVTHTGTGKAAVFTSTPEFAKEVAQFLAPRWSQLPKDQAKLAKVLASIKEALWSEREAGRLAFHVRGETPQKVAECEDRYWGSRLIQALARPQPSLEAT